MNIGRSEYTRLVRQEVRLKEAEKLLKECVPVIQDYLVMEENEYHVGRTLEEILKTDTDSTVTLIKDVKEFLENNNV